MTIRPKTAWYTEEVRDDTRLRRRLERKWRSNKQDYDNKQAYREQCATVTLRLYDANTLHYSAKIEECGRDPKALHKITDKLLKNNQQRLPANIEEQHLPAEFMSHFDNKIKNIRDKLNIGVPTTTD